MRAQSIPLAIKYSAACRGCILLTNDVHFSNILLYNPNDFLGIIRVRIHPPDFGKIKSCLEKLLNKLSSEDIPGKLIILEEEGFRIR